MQKAIATAPGEPTLYADLTVEEIEARKTEEAKPAPLPKPDPVRLLLEIADEWLKESANPKRAEFQQKLERLK